MGEMIWQFSGGRPETECGAGSTIAATKNIRAWLPGVFIRRRIRSLVDAPCGDFNWMARTDLSGIEYLGIDTDERHLTKARRASDPAAFAPQSKALLLCDIIADDLPIADAVLCRDFLQHLPNAHALTALNMIHRSGATWLIATSHTNPANDDIDKPGKFRPLNLTVPPFGFPEPIESVDDGAGRILGLWKL